MVLWKLRVISIEQDFLLLFCNDFLVFKIQKALFLEYFLIEFIFISSGKEEDSPIPLKATLARSATRRNTRKVPPITSNDKYSVKDDDVDSAYAASLESTLEAESHSEVSVGRRGLGCARCRLGCTGCSGGLVG